MDMYRRYSVEKVALKNFANFIGKHRLYGKVASLKPSFILKRDSNTGVSSEICKIFKSTFFEEHLRTTASICD